MSESLDASPAEKGMGWGRATPAARCLLLPWGSKPKQQQKTEFPGTKTVYFLEQSFQAKGPGDFRVPRGHYPHDGVDGV